MAVKVCRYCRTPAVVPGPRNEKRAGCCARCRWRGLLDLAAEDMLSREESDELQAELQR